jgi:hypothetical protein
MRSLVRIEYIFTNKKEGKKEKKRKENELRIINTNQMTI